SAHRLAREKLSTPWVPDSRYAATENLSGFFPDSAATLLLCGRFAVVRHLQTAGRSRFMLASIRPYATTGVALVATTPARPPVPAGPPAVPTTEAVPTPATSRSIT